MRYVSIQDRLFIIEQDIDSANCDHIKLQVEEPISAYGLLPNGVTNYVIDDSNFITGVEKNITEIYILTNNRPEALLVDIKDTSSSFPQAVYGAAFLLYKNKKMEDTIAVLNALGDLGLIDTLNKQITKNTESALFYAMQKCGYH